MKNVLFGTIAALFVLSSGAAFAEKAQSNADVSSTFGQSQERTSTGAQLDIDEIFATAETAD